MRRKCWLEDSNSFSMGYEVKVVTLRTCSLQASSAMDAADDGCSRILTKLFRQLAMLGARNQPSLGGQVRHDSPAYIQPDRWPYLKYCAQSVGELPIEGDVSRDTHSLPARLCAYDVELHRLQVSAIILHGQVKDGDCSSAHEASAMHEGKGLYRRKRGSFMTGRKLNGVQPAGDGEA